MKNLFLLIFISFFIFGCSQRYPAPDVQSYEYQNKKFFIETPIKTEDRSSVDVTYGKTKKFPSSNTDDLQYSQNDLNDNQTSINKFDVKKFGVKSFASIYFDFNKYNIKNKMKKEIQANANLLNSAENINSKILLEGNCDEIGSKAYNYNLGLKRANSVKSALISSGVNKDRIYIKSYGKTKPICFNNTKSCHQKNRRVDLILGKFSSNLQ